MRTKEPNIDLRLMDCMDLMAEYDDNHFDLAIVDPEFGIGIGRSNRLVTDKGLIPKKWDDKPAPPEYFHHLFRVSKSQIIWGGELLFIAPYKALHYMG